MLLKTNRLSLHKLTAADADIMLRLLNEPSFITNIADRGVRTLAQAQQYLLDGPIASYQQHGFGMYRVERQSDGVTLGLCGLVYRPYLAKPDIGYAFFPEFFGQAYAFEAAQAAFDYGKKVLQLSEIVGIVSPTNVPSKRILEKLGLETLRQVQSPDTGQWLDYYTETTGSF
ncbi:GNAT family N-acetyltransferase [Rheinheimera riviphila]|nr:GNAT family N-acetyltransferase [Rheinheimera riviphila]